MFIDLSLLQMLIYLLIIFPPVIVSLACTVYKHYSCTCTTIKCIFYRMSTHVNLLLLLTGMKLVMHCIMRALKCTD